MRIGILGSGSMGGKIGTIFTRAGHDVVFSYSRSQRKLKRLARRHRGMRGLAHRVRPLCVRMRCCWPCTGRASTPC